MALLNELVLKRSRLNQLDRDIPTNLASDILICSLNNQVCSSSILTAESYDNKTKFTCTDLEYTPYEQALWDVCNKFNVVYTITNSTDITVNSAQCPIISDIVFDIQQNNISEKCLLTLNIVSFLQDNCKDYNYTISKEKCNLAFDTLISKYPSCNLTRKQYQTLINTSNWTPLLIENIYSDNYSIINGGNTLKTLLKEYDLQDQLCFNSGQTEYFAGRQAYLEEVITDLPDTLKIKIIDSLST